MLSRPAPDFTLPAWTPEGRTTLTLSQQESPVVLAFYPGDDTPVCTRQLCSYQDDLEVLLADGDDASASRSGLAVDAGEVGVGEASGPAVSDV